MPKEIGSEFATVFTRFIRQASRSYGQLAQASGIPKNTIANWATGKVKQPRNQIDVIQLAAALTLNEVEASQLLLAANFPAITTLFKQAKVENDQALLTALTPWVSSSETASPPFQAVGQLPYFVGRQEVIEQVKTAVIQQRATLFILQGMGGVGKTALATELAYLLQPYFPDGILWARVDTADPMSILSTFAAAYGTDVASYTNLNGRRQAVWDLLKQKKSLIILDNVQNQTQLNHLIPSHTHACTIILTTRQANLTTLPHAHTIPLAPFQEDGDQALALFSHILGPERVARETNLLRQIAELLGYLPLALAIIAGHLTSVPTRRLWSQLEQRQKRLQTLVFDDYNVRLSFTVSYDDLDKETQHIFNAAGVFAGEDFSREATAYVADVDIPVAETALQFLQQRSLLASGRYGRYRLHPLLRDYAREQLNQPHIPSRMISFFVEYTQTHQRDYDALALEQSNIVAALTSAHAAHQWDSLVPATNAMFAFWLDRGLYNKANHFLSQANEAAHILEVWQPLARILHNQGLLAQKAGDYKQAESQLRLALTYAQRSKSLQEMMGIHINLGVLFSRRCWYRQAEEQYTVGLTLARELEDERGISYLLLNLGVMNERRGAYREAQKHLQEALAITRSSPQSTRIEAVILENLGVVALELEAYDLAETLLLDALQHSQVIGWREPESNILADLGSLRLRLHQLPEAYEHLQQSLHLARELTLPQAVAYTLVRLGMYWLRITKQEQDDTQAWYTALSQAENNFSETLTLAQKLAALEYIGLAQFGLAQVAYIQGHIATAKAMARNSWQTLSPIGHKAVPQVQAWLETYIDA